MRQSICVLVFIAAGISVEAAAQGKFSGFMFGDYYYNVARDTAFSRAGLPNSALTGAKDMQAFQFRRIYFTYDNDISQKFTARFRLEADQISNTSDGKFGVAVKDAYLKWKNIFSGSDLMFGLQPTTAFEVSEGVWSYRSLEKTIMDLRGIISSRDLGVSLRGRIDDESVFNYAVMIANGSGQRAATNKYMRYSLTFHVQPTKRFQFTLTGDYRDQANILDPNSVPGRPESVRNGVTTGSLFVGYSKPETFSVGIETFIQSTANGFNDVRAIPRSTRSRNAFGLSVFGTVYVQTDLTLLARFDHFDPNSHSNAKGDSRSYIICGLDWKVDKRVSIIPNIQIETYESAPSPSTRTYDASVTGRVTLHYTFL